ncbi:MAG TPA: DUF393 domain-containing protein [Verrucomicrobiae bacterium]
MTGRKTSDTPPPKPVLVFDGDCALCVAWVKRLRRKHDADLECAPYQDAQTPGRFPDLAPDQLAQSIHLIDAAGRVHRGAQAILRLPGGGWPQALLLGLCGCWPRFARMLEAGYGLVARNRRRLSRAFRKPAG